MSVLHEGMALNNNSFNPWINMENLVHITIKFPKILSVSCGEKMQLVLNCQISTALDLEECCPLSCPGDRLNSWYHLFVQSHIKKGGWKSRTERFNFPSSAMTYTDHLFVANDARIVFVRRVSSWMYSYMFVLL